MTEAAFVRRDFESDGQQVRCKFFFPTLEAGGEYKCRWTIEWPKHRTKHDACGIDGVQALILAMRVVHTELIASEEYCAGRLTYFGERDLDLLPPFGVS